MSCAITSNNHRTTFKNFTLSRLTAFLFSAQLPGRKPALDPPQRLYLQLELSDQRFRFFEGKPADIQESSGPKRGLSAPAVPFRHC